MIIQGNNFRSLINSTSGKVASSIDFPSGRSDFDLGLSGDSFFGVQSREGFLYFNNLMFGVSQDSQQWFDFEFSGSSANLYHNSKLIAHCVENPSSFADYLTFNSDASSIVDFRFKGNRPEVEFNILNNSNSGDSTVTGLFDIGSDRTYQIFSAKIDQQASPGFQVVSFPSGVVSGSSDILVNPLSSEPDSTQNVKFDFETNFGNFSVFKSINSDFIPATEIFTVSPDQEVFINNKGSRIFDITSFFYGPNRNLNVSLDWLAGGLSDQVLSLESGNITGLAEGFIKGCGTVYGTATNYLTDIVGLSGWTFSGNAAGEVSATWCHTGSAIFDKEVLFSGIVPSGDASGELYFTGLEVVESGVVGGGGFYDFNFQSVESVIASGATFDVTGSVDEIIYLYYTDGKPTGIVTSGVSVSGVRDVCGSFEGSSLISDTVDYYYNQDGFSGFIPVTFSGWHVPTGEYSEFISGLGVGTGIGGADISGDVSGWVYDTIDNELGQKEITGSISGMVPYLSTQCLTTGDRLVGNIKVQTTTLMDSYAEPTGFLYKFNFSPHREYLLGSGLPCNLFLSGHSYNLAEHINSLDIALDIANIKLDIYNKADNSILITKYLNEFVKFEDYLVNEETLRFPVNRTDIPELLNFDLTGDIYITGSYLVSGNVDNHSETYLELFIVTFTEQETEETGSVFYDYNITGTLTGEACIEGTGNINGIVSGVSSILEGSGIGSGFMLGPKLPIDFVDVWNVRSGLGSSFVDFKQSGWFESGQSGGYSGESPMITKQKFFNKPYVQVFYDKNGNSEQAEAKLKVWDELNEAEIILRAL